MKKERAGAKKTESLLFPLKWILPCFLLLSVINAGMFLILNQYISFEQLSWDFFYAGITYIILSAIFETLLVYFIVKKFLINPIRRLGDAAKQVAHGDFSVYVEPVHTMNRYNFLDELIEHFNAMIDDLGSLETMKTDFISNVSHEIRTPLGNIRNYAYALKNPGLSSRKRSEYADTIIEATERLNTMVTNILKLNKLENQAAEIKRENYDLCEQLSECVLVFEKVWSEKNIDINLDTEDRAIIYADRELLGLVWINLLSNAFKFTENGGAVSVHQISDKDTITVSITDTGCGMDVQTQKRMFEKFYQGDTSHSQNGNGLGLALVSRIIKLTGCELSVRSTVGEGSTFLVRLPYQNRNDNKDK